MMHRAERDAARSGHPRQSHPWKGLKPSGSSRPVSVGASPQTPGSTTKRRGGCAYGVRHEEKWKVLRTEELPRPWHASCPARTCPATQVSPPGRTSANAKA